jgi:hypothetical protein
VQQRISQIWSTGKQQSSIAGQLSKFDDQTLYCGNVAREQEDRVKWVCFWLFDVQKTNYFDSDCNHLNLLVDIGVDHAAPTNLDLNGIV